MIRLEAWVDIRSLHRNGGSIRQLARQMGLSRNPVRRYLRQDIAPKYRPRPARPSLLAPYTDDLRRRLEKLPELPATVLLREIRTQGYPGQITLLKDFVRPLRQEQRRLQELTVRYETAPGEQAQVDWGDFGHLPTGERLYGLSVVLSYSRLQFVYSTDRMTLPELLYGLVLAFEYFAGLPRRLLFDNPRTIVRRRGRTVVDSTLHPRFLDFLGHHALELQLCESARPQTKGKVERPMPYIRHSLVLPECAHWTTHAEANRAARHWLDTVANVRVHGTTRERPVERAQREALTPLSSVRPYDLAWREPRRVHRDCHFSWEGNRYSVPWQHGGSAGLVVRRPGGVLEVERDGVTLATHRERPRGRGETITRPEHLAGLWQKTLGRKERYGPPAPLPSPALVALPGSTPLLPLLLVALPEVEVERRDLAVYQCFLEEVAR